MALVNVKRDEGGRITHFEIEGDKRVVTDIYYLDHEAGLRSLAIAEVKCCGEAVHTTIPSPIPEEDPSMTVTTIIISLSLDALSKCAILRELGFHVCKPDNYERI